MRLVYISSPLRGDMEKNKEKAKDYCAYAASCGVIPLAPHTIFTQYLNDAVPEQREQGLRMGHELLERCDELWVMGDTISQGMKDEIGLATFLQLPILYVSDDMVTLCTQKYDMGDKTLYNLVTEAFPIVLFVKKLEDNSRRVMEITECEILEDGTRQLHTLYRYHVSETSIQDGKIKVHGEFQKVSTISASLQKRLLENGMPPRLLERIAGGGVKLDTGKEETA